MKDQAERLRMEVEKTNRRCVKTFAVVSGKGGVGKSNFALNFAISLSELGHKVLLFDMDIGMGNIDILMGKTAGATIVDYFEGRQSLKEIVMEGPGNLAYIAGGTGLARLIKLDAVLVDKFLQDMGALFETYEYVLFDMGAGIDEEILYLILAVDEIVLITTPEPTAITDAYSIMKHIHLHNADLPFLIVVNRVKGKHDGIKTFQKLRMTARKFLDREVIALGSIPEDKAVQEAVLSQVPFIFEKKSPASRAIRKIAFRYKQQLVERVPVSAGSPSFMDRLKSLLFAR